MNKPKTNIEILNEIRNSRNKELEEIGRKDISVIIVEALGTGEKTGKRLFRLVEEKPILDPKTEQPIIDEKTDETKKETWEWFYEYDNDLNQIKLIATRNPNTKERVQGGIMPLALSEDEQKLWEDEREDIEQCLEERERELVALAKELGIDPEEIDNLSEIELQQKVEEKQEEKEEEKDKNQKDEEPKQLSEEETKKIKMAGMNEIRLNSQVDSRGTTLGKVLKLDEYEKIMVVHSHQLSDVNQNRHHMKFGLVAQKADGTFEKIPEDVLRPYRGSNREVTEINNKENVEVKNEECMFEVPGTNKRLVINQKDPYGIPDVYLSQNTRDNDGQMAQKLQDRYDGTEKQDVEVRALFNSNKGINQSQKSVEEVREHEKAGCDEIDIDEADGNKNTGHIHFDLRSDEQQKAVEEIMEKGKVSREEAEAKLAKQLENSKEDITLEEATENAVEEIESDFRGTKNLYN